MNVQRIMAMTMMISSALAIFFVWRKKNYPQQFFYFYKSSCGRRKFEADMSAAEPKSRLVDPWTYVTIWSEAKKKSEIMLKSLLSLKPTLKSVPPSLLLPDGGLKLPYSSSTAYPYYKPFKVGNSSETLFNKLLIYEIQFGDRLKWIDDARALDPGMAFCGIVSVQIPAKDLEAYNAVCDSLFPLPCTMPKCAARKTVMKNYGLVGLKESVDPRTGDVELLFDPAVQEAIKAQYKRAEEKRKVKIGEKRKDPPVDVPAESLELPPPVESLPAVSALPNVAFLLQSGNAETRVYRAAQWLESARKRLREAEDDVRNAQKELSQAQANLADVKSKTKE